MMRQQGTRAPGSAFNSKQPTGLVLNKMELRDFKEFAYANQKVEFLYLRENEFEAFNPYIPLPMLKILDLSLNSLKGPVDFLALVPNVRHLYLTGNKIDTLDGFTELHQLETLCLSDNLISSFEGLDKLQSLRVLSLNFNSITSFRYYPYLPSLHTLNLVGNPVAQLDKYRPMAIALSNPQLVSIDGTPVQDAERAAVEHYRGKVCFCISEGFTIAGDQIEEDADAFLLDLQRLSMGSKPLQLQSIRLSSAENDSNVLLEGHPVELTVCLRDIRPVQQRQTDIFYSPFLFPVAFKVSGDATEVFVVGSMNGWGDPIPLERCTEGSEVCFQTTLYLPAGDYEYRYIVDGVERLTGNEKATSKFKQGPCNICHVTEAAPADDEQTTVLYVRWMRSNRNNGFNLIEGEHSLSYTPTSEDIGFCLRAEVLVYINSEFSFMYFDISTPISAGPPSCSRLEIVGNPCEGEHLSVVADYCGGVEGQSALQWYRIMPNNEEVQLTVDDPFAGYDVTIDDINCKLKIEYTPMREDWVAGTPVSTVTCTVTAGTPICKEIQIVGKPIQDGALRIQKVYAGGHEGDSKFQWYRHEATTDEFLPINGETTMVYSPCLHDVGKLLACEYTPVSQEGIVGEVVRVKLNTEVEPALPEIRSITISGPLEEGGLLVVQFEYFGGNFGAHKIQWYRRDDANRLTKIGRENVMTYTLTAKEIGHTIEVLFVPVRDDKKEGQQVTASTAGVIAPGQPQLKSLAVRGEAKQNQFLECVPEYWGGEEGESIIEWTVFSEEINDYEVVARQTKKWLVMDEHLGKMARLRYTPVRKDGVSGQTVFRMIQIDPAAPAEEPVGPN